MGFTQAPCLGRACKISAPLRFILAAHPTLHPTCHHSSKGARWCPKANSQWNATGFKSHNSSTGTCRSPGLLQRWDRMSPQPQKTFLTSTATNWFLERKKVKITDVSTKMNLKWTCWQLENWKVIQAKAPGFWQVMCTWIIGRKWPCSLPVPCPATAVLSPWDTSLKVPRLSQGQAQCPAGADRKSSPLFPLQTLLSTQHLQGKVALPLPFLFNHNTRFSPLSVVFQSTESFVLYLLSIFTIIPSHIHISVATQLYPAF